MLVRIMEVELILQRLITKVSPNPSIRISMGLVSFPACSNAMTSFSLELSKSQWEELVRIFSLIRDIIQIHVAAI